MLWGERSIRVCLYLSIYIYIYNMYRYMYVYIYIYIHIYITSIHTYITCIVYIYIYKYPPCAQRDSLVEVSPIRENALRPVQGNVYERLRAVLRGFTLRLRAVKRQPNRFNGSAWAPRHGRSIIVKLLLIIITLTIIQIMSSNHNSNTTDDNKAHSST